MLEKCAFEPILGCISGTIVLNGLKIDIRAGPSHKVPHTNLKPFRLKDVEHVGWDVAGSHFSKQI